MIVYEVTVPNACFSTIYENLYNVNIKIYLRYRWSNLPRTLEPLTLVFCHKIKNEEKLCFDSFLENFLGEDSSI